MQGRSARASLASAGVARHVVADAAQRDQAAQLAHQALAEGIIGQVLGQGRLGDGRELGFEGRARGDARCRRRAAAPPSDLAELGIALDQRRQQARSARERQAGIDRAALSRAATPITAEARAAASAFCSPVLLAPTASLSALVWSRAWSLAGDAPGRGRRAWCAGPRSRASAWRFPSRHRRCSAQAAGAGAAPLAGGGAAPAPRPGCVSSATAGSGPAGGRVGRSAAVADDRAQALLEIVEPRREIALAASTAAVAAAASARTACRSMPGGGGVAAAGRATGRAPAAARRAARSRRLPARSPRPRRRSRRRRPRPGRGGPDHGGIERRRIGGAERRVACIAHGRLSLYGASASRSISSSTAWRVGRCCRDGRLERQGGQPVRRGGADGDGGDVRRLAARPASSTMRANTRCRARREEGDGIERARLQRRARRVGQRGLLARVVEGEALHLEALPAPGRRRSRRPRRARRHGPADRPWARGAGGRDRPGRAQSPDAEGRR